MKHLVLFFIVFGFISVVHAQGYEEQYLQDILSEEEYAEEFAAQEAVEQGSDTRDETSVPDEQVPDVVESSVQEVVVPTQTVQTPPPAAEPVMMEMKDEDVREEVLETQSQGTGRALQRNQSDLQFLRERASPVSVQAVEVRGWDPLEKEDFVEEVLKYHAELQSEQDLENFARGILLEDENVESVDIKAGSMTVGYKMPARLLGIFPTRLSATASVTAVEVGIIQYGRVNVRFPWYRLFYSVSPDADVYALETAIDNRVNREEDYSNDSTIQKQARVLQAISNVMKRSHDVAMNSIRNIK